MEPLVESQFVGINISTKYKAITIIAILINIFGVYLWYAFQGFDYGCGTHCDSSIIIWTIIIYYISVIASLFLLSQKPIILAFYLIVASIAGIVFSMIFGLLPFAMLFYSGGKIMEINWKLIEIKERRKQILTGVIITAIVILLCVIRIKWLMS